MATRIIFIHGNGTNEWSETTWAVWLKAKLDTLGFETIFQTLPDSQLARASFWLPYLQDTVAAGPHDILIGHSSGATAAMRYAENHKLLGSILVSPSYTDLGDKSEKQSGYYDTPWDWKAIRSNQKHLALTWGDDDPYISQVDFAYMALHLGADKLKIPGGQHFSDRQDFPEILRYITTTYKSFIAKT